MLPWFCRTPPPFASSASPFTDEETESQSRPQSPASTALNGPGAQRPGPWTPFPCAAHVASLSPHVAPPPPQSPHPHSSRSPQPLGTVNTRQRQANKRPTPFISQAPGLIRFSSFLPVLGQSLLKTVENSFAPAVRKRLSPVRKVIKPSSHIRGNESPLFIRFAGRLFSSHWQRRCEPNLSLCQVDPLPLHPPPLAPSGDPVSP